MPKMIRRLYYKFKAWRIEFWQNLNKNKFTYKFLPKIKNKPPLPPHDGVCPKCLELYKTAEEWLEYPINTIELYAVDTGDGWAFGWQCNSCDDLIGEEDLDWWPYKFGVYVSYNQLRKMGIEVN